MTAPVGSGRSTRIDRISPAAKGLSRPSYVPPREATSVQLEAADYNWKWPAREERKQGPQIKRPDALAERPFLEEYELRPPWLKY